MKLLPAFKLVILLVPAGRLKAKKLDILKFQLAIFWPKRAQGKPIVPAGQPKILKIQ